MRRACKQVEHNPESAGLGSTLEVESLGDIPIEGGLRLTTGASVCAATRYTRRRRCCRRLRRSPTSGTARSLRKARALPSSLGVQELGVPCPGRNPSSTAGKPRQTGLSGGPQHGRKRQSGAESRKTGRPGFRWRHQFARPCWRSACLLRGFCKARQRTLLQQGTPGRTARMELSTTAAIQVRPRLRRAGPVSNSRRWPLLRLSAASRHSRQRIGCSRLLPAAVQVLPLGSAVPGTRGRKGCRLQQQRHT